MILEPSVGIKHIGIAEVAFLHGPANSDKGPVRNGNLLHLGSDDLENACLENHFPVGCMDLGELSLGTIEIAEQICLVAPQAKAPSDELSARMLEAFGYCR